MVVHIVKRSSTAPSIIFPSDAEVFQLFSEFYLPCQSKFQASPTSAAKDGPLSQATTYLGFSFATALKLGERSDLKEIKC